MYSCQTHSYACKLGVDSLRAQQALGIGQRAMCDFDRAGFHTQWGHWHCLRWRSMMGQGLLRPSTAQDPMATSVGASPSEPSTDPPSSPPNLLAATCLTLCYCLALTCLSICLLSSIRLSVRLSVCRCIYGGALLPFLHLLVFQGLLDLSATYLVLLSN